MYSALEIAKYIIGYCNDKDYRIDNLRLQKILFIVQIVFLEVFQRPCFHEEIEAWRYGPVVPVVYDEYKMYGSNLIFAPLEETSIRKEDLNEITSIVDDLEKYSTNALVKYTHSNPLWRTAFADGFGTVIHKKDMFKFAEGIRAEQ